MLTLSIAGRSHAGCVREHNEDCIDWWCGPDGDRALVVVADGMGGYAGGEDASRMAVDLCMARLPSVLEGAPADAGTLAEALSDTFLAVNAAIREARESQPDQAQMGTTLVVALVAGDRAMIAHVGDSRCYHWTGDCLCQVTRDDTVVQNMVDDGSISAEQAGRVPFRNILTKALGAEDDVQPTIAQFNLRPGDGLLLCSDGLAGALDSGRWPAHLSGAPEQAVDGLIQASLDAGADDNVSVLWLRADG